MNVDFVKIFRGKAWLPIHEPCMANYTLVGNIVFNSALRRLILITLGE